jgi:ferredoxin
MGYELKHVLSKFFNGIEQRMMYLQQKWSNATSEETGSTVKEERKNYIYKSDPIREHDCIWCMTCVLVCPPQAIKVNQSNLEYHEKVSGAFNESLSKGVHHHVDTKNSCTAPTIREKTRLKVNFIKYQMGCLLEGEEGVSY